MLQLQGDAHSDQCDPVLRFATSGGIWCNTPPYSLGYRDGVANRLYAGAADNRGGNGSAIMGG